MLKSCFKLYCRALSVLVLCAVGAIGQISPPSGGGTPGGAAGGDLSGTYPNPGVAKVNGGSVPASQTCLGSNGSSQIIAGTCIPSGAAGGDLGGTYPNPSVNVLSLLKGGWPSTVDPRQCDSVHMYCASGSSTTTTGTMAQSSNQLTVASATGWTVGMGISVAGGIAGGSELGGENNPAVSVTAITGTTFTLSANCTRVGGVSGVTVNHEDSVAINAALTSGFAVVHLSAGTYNITSRGAGQDILTLATPVMFLGDGSGKSTLIKRSIGSAVIRISADSFGIGVESGVVSDMAIGMGSGFTATDGPGVYMASTRGAGFYVNSWHVERMLIIGQCEGLYTGTGVNVDWFRDIRIYSAPSGCAAQGGGIRVNTPSPGGDIQFDDIQLAGLSTGLVITNADTNTFTNLKINGGQILVNPTTDGVVIRQRFINASIEGQGGSATCGVQFSNHTSDQMEFIGGGIGLNYTNGICPTAATTGLRVVGMHFYGMGGYGVSQSGGSSTITANDFTTTSGAVNLFGSATASVVGNTASTGVLVNTNAVANKVYLGANNTTLGNTFGAGTIVNYSGYLRGTTGSIGGALTVGACDTGTSTVTGATTSMVATASPVTYPGDGYVYQAYVSAADTVTVKLCGLIVGTPTSSAYNVSVSAN